MSVCTKAVQHVEEVATIVSRIAGVMNHDAMASQFQGLGQTLPGPPNEHAVIDNVLAVFENGARGKTRQIRAALISGVHRSAN